jgi:hypothetical protein
VDKEASNAAEWHLFYVQDMKGGATMKFSSPIPPWGVGGGADGSLFFFVQVGVRSQFYNVYQRLGGGGRCGGKVLYSF